MSEELEEVQVVTITGENGAEEYYDEIAQLEIDDKVFSVLIPIPSEEHDHDGCDCGCEDEDEAIIARVDIIDGEPTYVAPTDEEFEKAAHAYQELVESEFAEDDDEEE